MFNTLISSVRSAAVRTSFVNARTFHASPAAAKTVTEKVSEVADKVNKNVGKGLASAIETGEKATQTTKEALGSASEQTKEKAEHASSVAEKATQTTKEALGSASEQTKEKAEHASNVAGQKTNEAAAGARETKEDLQKDLRK
ncbi:hypothetical protein Hypma_015134 [Hypsizygus marmoreus]|uniref:Uncharacterized protein n=1 Tax=Hypsizygus marmoreus TaxID=39966 RepID=A0A369KFF4_HYPMA|nr:hypothetical protein Hypma_015134 [Hypsizygus marmoreus]